MGILDSIMQAFGGDDVPTCECGEKMTDYDGVAWYTCPACGNMKRDNGDGSWSWENEIFSGANHNGEECPSCGQGLSGASFTAPWEDGDNVSGYVTCPHCGYKIDRD